MSQQSSSVCDSEDSARPKKRPQTFDVHRIPRVSADPATAVWEAKVDPNAHSQHCDRISFCWNLKLGGTGTARRSHLLMSRCQC